MYNREINFPFCGNNYTKRSDRPHAVLGPVILPLTGFVPPTVTTLHRLCPYHRVPEGYPNVAAAVGFDSLMCLRIDSSVPRALLPLGS